MNANNENDCGERRGGGVRQKVLVVVHRSALWIVCKGLMQAVGRAWGQLKSICSVASLFLHL